MQKRIKRVIALCIMLILCLTAAPIHSSAASDWISSNIKSVVFDANYYASHNADVKNALGTSYSALYNHFLEYGSKEGRQGSPLFHSSYYLSNNADLKAAFGTNRVSAINHFGSYGYKEVTRKVAKSENLGSTFEAKMVSSSGSTVGLTGTNVTPTNNLSEWVFTLNSDGTYTIKNKSTGQVLDVYAGSANSGTNIQTYTSNATNAQKWYIFKYASGQYVIRSKCAPLRVMTISSGNVVSSTYTGAKTQIFSLKALENNTSGGSGNTDSGNTGSSSQPTTTTEFYAKILGIASNKYLDLSSDNVVIKKASSSNTQIWRFKQNSDGTYTITNKSTNKVLDVYAAGTTPGTNVHTYASNGTAAQRWILTEKNGIYTIEAKCAKGCVLDVAANGTADGTNVQIYTSNGTNAQKFEILKLQGNGDATKLSASTVQQVLSEMTTYEKATLVILASAPNSMAGQIRAFERFGIPSVQFADGPAGLRLTQNTLAYPSGTTLASTWNNDIVQDITAFMGEDCRNFGVEMLLAPGMNIQKNILNGRNFEYFSEDPYLTGLMAANYTLGLQSTGVSVALKHYAANNQETNRMNVSVEVTERALREIYLRAFEYAVDIADPHSVMTSYNKIQGIYSGVNKNLVDVLREEFGFSGFVMTDWGTQINRVDMLKSGNDLYCGGNVIEEKIVEEILNGLNKGSLKMEQLNACCENILNYIVISNAMKDIDVTNTITNKAAKLKAIRQAGAEGTVLLKNDDNTLPLPITTVSLFGNASYRTEHCGYGSGYVNTSGVVSIKQGLENAGIVLNSSVTALYKNCGQNAFGDADRNPSNDPYEITVTSTIARDAAKISECAIYTISRITAETVDHENRAGDFLLNAKEKQAIQNLAAAFHAQGKKLIVIINTGNPIEVASWEHLADAIIYAGLSGEQIGNSIGDIIRGKVNPSGKLTSTWPKKFSDTPYAAYFPGDYNSVVYNDDIYVGYRYYTTFGVDVMYEFGYGLSYTNFEYSNYKVKQDGKNYVLSVDVKNVGKVAGKDVVQFYVTKPDGQNEHPLMELVGYGKTKNLAPGATQTIEVTVSYDELKTYSTEYSRWFIEEGEYAFHVASSVNDVHFTEKEYIEEEIIVSDVDNILKDTSNVAVISKDRPKFDFTSSKNIALGKKTNASFSESGCASSQITDGKTNTRWSGVGSSGNTYWVSVDLGSVQYVKDMIILWEANSNRKFNVYLSDDNKTWVKLGEFLHSQANVVDIDQKTRYIKVEGVKKEFFSIYEIGIYK